jgi:RHS repeat-associated protein
MMDQSSDKTHPADRSASKASQADMPRLALPKGGGAIRGIGEKFESNPVTGTGSVTVPIATSPGRSGFEPKLSLSYNSGSGNGPFGFGWSMGSAAVTRKTDKGLPQYNDAQNSDIFILSDSEDLMPALIQDKETWTLDISQRALYGSEYNVQRYRPRVEGLFARIERWTNASDSSDVFWRTISKENVTTWLGSSAESRIADPADPTRIFSWLISSSYDDKGNVIVYGYKAEDEQGVDLTQANERNRTVASRSAQRYLKQIQYGNRMPYIPDLTAQAPTPLPTDWCFTVVYDYGEHAAQAPTPAEIQPWNCRLDPSSTYRSGFEVRTYRLCQRVLMFHTFPADPSVGTNCLVRSTSLVHASALPADGSQPFYSYLLSVSQSGYTPNGAGGYLSSSLPPIEFTYTAATIDETVQEIDPTSVMNLPGGIDSTSYRWVDLDGEGLSGVLTEQGGTWFYKANLSPANLQGTGPAALTLAAFAPVRTVEEMPSLAALGTGRQQLLGLSGDGFLSLVEFGGATPGYFERTQDYSWEPFMSFRSMPVLDWQNPNLRFVDLTGDGFADALISEDDVFWWHQSLSTEGFGPAQRVEQSFDEEQGPQLVFADGTESIFLADMSGDGLTDLVRIRAGEVCYWPNLGYGRFGAKVTMDGVPRLDRQEVFDARRVRLADIDGSGTADLIYFAAGEVHLYFSQSGNSFAERRILGHFPLIDTASSAAVLDLLGNGTACLVWSSPLAGNTRSPMRYIDLMGGVKPHLLVGLVNNLGAETHVHYAPSTKFYVQDKLAGTPWITRLPFPVQTVERVEILDLISRNRFVTRYAYHHGYYDGVEREFRGFARVDQWDSEDFATLNASSTLPPPGNESTASNVPPILTKTWFHTGFFFSANTISTALQNEYYREGDAATSVVGLNAAEAQTLFLPDSTLPATILLDDGSRVPWDFSGEEMREACRVLRGSVLRQEVYALDGTAAADRPYTTSEKNYTIEMLQPEGPNPYGVFLTWPRESLDMQYERKLFAVEAGALADQAAPPADATLAADPRASHTMTLTVDGFGNALQSASIGYGRRFLDPALSSADQVAQQTLLATATIDSFTNAIFEQDANRTPLPAQGNVYQLYQCQPAANAPNFTNLFQFAEMQGLVASASDGAHDIPFEGLNPSGLNPSQPYRRLVNSTRTLYRPDDLGQAAGNPDTLLALGTIESMAIPGCTYKQAFTSGLIGQVFTRGATTLLPTPATVLGSTAADGGGYVDLDGNGNWWIPSTRIYYSPTAGTAAQESTAAAAHYYQPQRYVDSFGNVTVVAYDDPNDLLVTSTTDPVGNVVQAQNDYRVLAPALVTDANGNQTAAQFDALGLVAGTVVMGKEGQGLGDSFNTFTADLTQVQIDAFFAAADPHTLAASLLGTATTRIIYNPQQYVESRLAAPTNPAAWQPVFSAILVREIHQSDLGDGQSSPIQIKFSYSDGFGREIQQKLQADPGPVISGGPIVNPRWVGSGWTIFNNKGKPVRKYEPFFSQLPALGHQFEFGVQIGVSSILCYDPAGRLVATVHPNQTFEKVIFDPWHQQTWDVNDTVLIADPTADADVGDFFSRLAPADYTPTWYQQRSAGVLGAWEQDAANKSAAHANTPTTSYFDTMGRSMLTIADNAADGKYETHTQFDIQGNQLSVTDALSRQIVVYAYDMLATQLSQSSMEAGQRWMLQDTAGKTIRSWDNRGHNLRAEFDALRRPTANYVQGTDPVNSDSRTLGGELCSEITSYGEGHLNAQALNLRTRIYQSSDVSGTAVNMGVNPATTQQEAYDFKGNLLRSAKQFIANPKALTNWAGAAPALLPAFMTSTSYDALNRPTSVTSADGSVTTPAYNARNALAAVSVRLLGAATATEFVTEIDYNAKLQRLSITYASNGTNTAYTYDPLTFRMAGLTTTRPSFPANQQTVQDLTYTYDPMGNITHIEDDADIQNTVFFRNRRVDPSAGYTYDAIYRLIEATGREQLGMGGNGSPLAPTPTSYNDVPRAGLLQPGDGNAMGTYEETYQYDQVGNLTKFIHSGSDPANPGWSRAYAYNETSLLDAAQVSNRLSSSTIAGNQPFVENYSYDPHGNMTAMPQLQQMQWDFRDRLLMTRRQAVNGSDTQGEQAQGQQTWNVYNAAGERVCKATFSSAGILLNERFYLNGAEFYREFNASGNMTLERQSLHVMDDKQRIALVETVTVDNTAAAGSLPISTQRYQFSNHLSSALLELDETAAVITYEEYYPFGSTSYQAGASATEVSLKRYRYTGKERDEETGLYYQGARYYAPWLGRWTACDPIGTQDGPNIYAYCSNNPIMLHDPTGTDGDDDKGTTIGVTPENGPGEFSLFSPPRLRLDPANFWYSSLSQGTGRLSPGAFDVELGAYLIGASTTGLQLPKGSLFGLQTGQLGFRKAVGEGGLDLGAVFSGNYTVGDSGSGGGGSAQGTIHYGFRSDKGPGDLRHGGGFYAQVGANYLTLDKKFAPTFSLTGVYALEQKDPEPVTKVDLSKPPDNPYIPSLSAVVLNPIFTYSGEGQLTQGPLVSNLITGGLTAGVQLGWGGDYDSKDAFSLLFEVSGVGEHGSPLGSSNQSVLAGKVTAGIVGTYTWLGKGTEAQTNSIAVGIWGFYEAGSVSGTPTPDAPTGSFRSSGAIGGITFGYRSPAQYK